MIENYTLKFLQGIKKNNNKPWFEKNRALYEGAKQNILSVTDTLVTLISGFDPTVKNVIARDCIFRINRDVRFSKNKAPYKTNMAIYINSEGKKADSPGYYLHIEPGKSFLATGVWMPGMPVLNKIRQEIDYNFNTWNNLLQKKSFRKSFPEGISREGALVRPPKGYDAANPAIQFLLLKSFIVVHEIKSRELTEKGLEKKLSEHYKNAKPFIDFLRMAIS
ncbi:MAG: DUF2461 domain-containing protein [Chitinophagaceae bacterium]|nr:DUF2461 domain-containing protein [Bacteroidota bacterium]MCC6258882.1 DUF2461 domain-containing protein [Chitinophagaceae bacterium]